MKINVYLTSNESDEEEWWGERMRKIVKYSQLVSWSGDFSEYMFASSSSSSAASHQILH
jgi:hypothetical protein